MAIQGSGLHDKNVRLRFFAYIFMGIVALGSILYWRIQLMANAEYGEVVPVKNELKIEQAKKQSTTDKIKSKNYQIETFDTQPSVN